MQLVGSVDLNATMLFSAAVSNSVTEDTVGCSGGVPKSFRESSRTSLAVLSKIADRNVSRKFRCRKVAKQYQIHRTDIEGGQAPHPSSTSLKAGISFGRRGFSDGGTRDGDRE
jgi:hypothetical protein